MRAHPHFNPFSVREPSELPNWDQVFQNPGLLDLEIGFSNGTWLVGYAKKFPARNIVGLEIRTKFIQAAKEKIQQNNIFNAYVLKANANTALAQLLKPETLSRVFILFPDPWYKKGHLKRRVVGPEFIKELAKYLVPQGELYIATDKKIFAEEMLKQLEESKLFVNLAGAKKFAEQTIAEVSTDIENYHQKLGNPIYRMNFQKIA